MRVILTRLLGNRAYIYCARVGNESSAKLKFNNPAKLSSIGIYSDGRFMGDSLYEIYERIKVLYND